MNNPYKDLPNDAFWRPSVAEQERHSLRLTVENPLRLHKTDILGTAGSCFAQNVGRYVKETNLMPLLETESRTSDQPLFSANYGNIYTPAQLDQLIAQSMGDFAFAFDHPESWVQQDNRFYDLFRPRIEAKGFASLENLISARKNHLEAVKKVFTDSSVFIFTLGLTETWLSSESKIVYPICPASLFENAPKAQFYNFNFSETKAAMESAIRRARTLNPELKIILSVSPVPLTATYSGKHILVATTYSKSILRAVASEIVNIFDNISYFPSYELITAPFFDQHCFESNRRSVRKEAIALAMETFEREYFTDNLTDQSDSKSAQQNPSALFDDKDENIICDEEETFKSIGF